MKLAKITGDAVCTAHCETKPKQTRNNYGFLMNRSQPAAAGKKAAVEAQVSGHPRFRGACASKGGHMVSYPQQENWGCWNILKSGTGLGIGKPKKKKKENQIGKGIEVGKDIDRFVNETICK